MKSRTILLVLGLYAVSLVMRASSIDTPLGLPTPRHYDTHQLWITATVLMYIDNWFNYGLAECHYTPRFTYPGRGSRWITNRYACNAILNGGTIYYVSVPNLGLLVPWAWFKLLGVRPAVFPLQVLSLLLHLIDVLLLTLIILRLAPSLTKVHWGALLGATVALLTPISLWYQGNFYAWTNLGNTLWLAAIWLWIPLTSRLEAKERGTAWRMAMVFLFLVAGMMTDYFGFAVALAIFLYHFFQARRGWKHIAMMVGATLAVLVSTSLTLHWYSQAVGWDKLLSALAERWAVRSGAGITIDTALHKHLTIYNHAYGIWIPIIGLLGGGALWLCLSQRRKLGEWFTGRSSMAFFGFVLPVAMIHLLLLNYSSWHEFEHIKDTYVLALLGAFFLQQVIESTHERFTRTVRLGGVIALGLFTLIGIIWGNWEYRDQYVENNPSAERLGQLIRDQSDPDELVLLQTRWTAFPQIQWYAGRNLVSTLDPEAYLRSKSQAKARVFEIRGFEYMVATRIKSISLDSAGFHQTPVVFPNSHSHGRFLDTSTGELVKDAEYPETWPVPYNK